VRSPAPSAELPRENLAAEAITFTADELATIDAIAPRRRRRRATPAAAMASIAR